MPVKDPNSPRPGVPTRPKTTESLRSDVYKEEKPSPFSIEGIRSGAVQSKVFKGLIIASGLIMAGGLFVGGLGDGGAGGGVAGTDVVAKVGDEGVTQRQLSNALAQQEQFNSMLGQKTTVATYLDGKKRALENLTGGTAVLVAAQKSNIAVSESDIDVKIDKLISDELKPQNGQTAAQFRRATETQYGSLEAARTKLREGLDREAVRKQLLVEKLEKQVKDENKVSEDDYKRSVTRLKLYQIVVRPELPKNAKDLKAETEKLNAKAETEAAKLAADLKKTPTLANFKSVALKSSDDASTKAKGGDAGAKLPREIFPVEFGETLAKSTEKIVGPLKAPSGEQTLFFVENRKLELPKDFAKNKKKLLADFETERDNAAWQTRQDELKKQVTPEVTDPALVAFDAQSSGDLFTKPVDQQKTAREAMLEQYTQAIQGKQGLEAAAIGLQMARLYSDLKRKPEQLVALNGAVENAPQDVDLRLEYVRALRDNGQAKPAQLQLQEASKILDDTPPTPPSPFGGGGGDPTAATRAQIAGEFDALKQPKLAEAERRKIKPAAPMPMGGAGGAGGLPPGIQIMPNAR